MPGITRGLLPPLTLAALVAAGCSGGAPPVPGAPPTFGTGPAAFVGRAACAECHEAEVRAWTGSDHDRSMDAATDATVLGDFSGPTLTQGGVTSRFLRREGKFVVRTEGSDGIEQDFEVAYAFGVRPLQQYLAAFPGGRLQVLPFCWDSRPKGAGGGRWFHLYGEERIPPGDLLFWTRGQQNWNHMCAECHSTGVEKNYRADRDIFETSWKEIDVSCEACHGPGSAHVAWGRAKKAGRKVAEDPGTGLLVRLGDRGREGWLLDPTSGNALRRDPEVETCARCHSRRSVLEDRYQFGRPLLDTHMPALLEEGVYHPDGQILEEDYEYGSFLQSRMYRRGVSCRDCHDPHSLRLRREPGNATCAKCHDPAHFDAREHHRHREGTEAAACVSCHMPAATYMGVDVRRDHSLRIPRPDLTRRIGAPNACNAPACHGDRDASWAQTAVERWYPQGRWGTPHWGEAIHAGRRRLPGAGEALAAVAGDRKVPGIARATAVELLGGLGGPAAARAVPLAAADEDPLVRAMAARASEVLPPGERIPLLARLSRDAVRAVRVETGQAALGIPAAAFPDGARSARAAAEREWRRAQEVNADRAEAHFNLGVAARVKGDGEAAEAEFRRAIRIEPLLPAPHLELADLLRSQGRDLEADRALSAAPGPRPAAGGR